MKRTILFAAAAGALGAALLASGCSRAAKEGPRTITVAQSGTADIIGSDSAALQKAADMVRPGDTLVIGPGTYTMENSLFVPSGVTVRGTPGKTILKKGAGVESPLAVDAGYGIFQLTPENPERFRAGMGVSVLSDNNARGWNVSVTTITAIEGNILHINPMTIQNYTVVPNHARLQNTFPIIAVLRAENVVLDGLVADGNKDENAYLDGCRGGAIYLKLVRNVTVRNCIARNYHGDGISFQITSGVRVLNCESYGNTGLGVHPGTGSDRPLVEGCRIHDNGRVGLFLCWRVRHGTFSNNLIERNGDYGISIGHKDTDNLFVNNTVRYNGRYGVYFRPETFANSGHRNTFRRNTIVDNGNAETGAGFYVAPHATGIVIENNRVGETRSKGRTQRYGVYKVTGAGAVTLRNNDMAGNIAGSYKEGKPLP